MTKKKRLHLFLPATNKHHIHKCKSAPVLSSSPRYEDTWLSRGTAPSISNVRTRRRRIISFTEDKSPRVCVEQGAVWAQEEMWALWSRDIQGIHKRMVRFRKLTGNLFLALHGHNVHRQQRQLSKFLMRYQQFASHVYCGAAGQFPRWCRSRKRLSVCSVLHHASFLNRARNSRCTVITDLDTSKRSTRKAFSCCDAILETGSAAPQ